MRKKNVSFLAFSFTSFFTIAGIASGAFARTTVSTDAKIFRLADCQYAAYSNENGETLSARHFEAMPEQFFLLNYAPGAVVQLRLHKAQSSMGDQYVVEGQAQGRGFFQSQGAGGVFGNRDTFAIFNCEGLRPVKYFFRTPHGEVFTIPWKKGRNLRDLLTTSGTCVAGDLSEAVQDLNTSFEFGSSETLVYDVHQGLSWSDVKLKCSKFEDPPPPGETPPANPNCLEWDVQSKTDYTIPLCP